MYLIKGDAPLHELIKAFQEENFNIEGQHSNEFKIHVTEERMEDFYLILSLYILTEATKYWLQKEFKKMKIKEEEIDSLAYQAVTSILTGEYWVGMTFVLVRDYLRNQHVLHVESFYHFFIQGMKEELKEELKKNFPVFIQQKRDLPNISESSIKDDWSIEKIRKFVEGIAEDNGIDVLSFQELHLFPDGERIQIEDQEGTVISLSFLEDSLGVALRMDDLSLPDIIKDLLVLALLCDLFPVKKVVVHQGFSEEGLDAIVHQETLIKQRQENFIAFEYCSGCDRCD